MGDFLSLPGKIEVGAERVLEDIAPVGIDAKGDASGRQFGNIKHGAVVRSVEQNPDLAGVLVLHIVEENDMERCAADTVAVIGPVNDVDADAGFAGAAHIAPPFALASAWR